MNNVNKGQIVAAFILAGASLFATAKVDAMKNKISKLEAVQQGQQVTINQMAAQLELMKPRSPEESDRLRVVCDGEDGTQRADRINRVFENPIRASMIWEKIGEGTCRIAPVGDRAEDPAPAG